MLRRPVFKPHLVVERIDDDVVFLLDEESSASLRGELVSAVVPWIDGTRSTEDVAAALAPAVSEAEVYYVVEALDRAGYLIEQPTLPNDQAAFWSIQGVLPDEASRALATTKVVVRAAGDVCVDPFLASLEAVGVCTGGDGDLEVVVTDDYLRPDLAGLSAGALGAGKCWLAVKPVGRHVWLGPLFRPGASPCWSCLAIRLQASRRVEGFVRRARAGCLPVSTSRATTAATSQLAFGLAATKVGQWVVRREVPELDGQLLSFDTVSTGVTFHVLVPQPTCPGCGGGPAPDVAPAAPVELSPSKKAFRADGGHRTVTPDETLARYGHHVSPITGAVSRLESYAGTSGAARRLPVYVAGINLMLAPENLDRLRASCWNAGAGKGMTTAQAKASALCEALERYSSAFQGNEPRIRSTFTELRGEAIHPNDCMLYSDRQFRDRAGWNARDSLYTLVPAPFDPDTAIEWTPMWSLTHRTTRYLPTAFCYQHYPVPSSRSFCIGCSNGNAAGNTVEEAVLQGFCELVERDSVALWWYNRLRRAAVDIDSFGVPALGVLRSWLEAEHRDLWALDLTSDLDVPVFAALSSRPDRGGGQVVLGFGAHLDPTIALLRAVSEMQQMQALLLPSPDGADDRPAPAPVDDPDARAWLATATVENQPYLLPDRDAPARTAGDYRDRSTDDLYADVLACQAIVEDRGMELLVLDQTRPEIGLPVVKVVVPGLRHFWARLAPGRLYDVPVRQGWVDRPRAEEDLNPVPMFL